MTSSKLLTALIIASGFFVSSALAQGKSEKDAIKVTIQPYVWVPTLNGSATLATIGAPVHVVPKDFVEGLQIGAMGGAKIEQHNRFIYLDAIVMDYDNHKFRPFFGQPLSAKIRYYDFGIGITKTLRLDKHRSLTLSPQIGVQYLYLLADVNGSLIVAKAEGKWWSPSAGLVASIPLNKRFSAVVSANAAGFGLGRTNYQNGSASLQYRLGRHWDVSAGYRIAKGRYDSPNGLSINLDGGGPIVAIAYKFELSK
jgi:hypothetical protein